MIGYGGCVIVIAGKSHTIQPPTIRRIAGASYYLSDTAGCETLADVIDNMRRAENYAHALSWFIAGDESLVGELSEAPVSELLSAMKAVYSLIDIQDFLELSTLARNVARLTANPRPQAISA